MERKHAIDGNISFKMESSVITAAPGTEQQKSVKQHLSRCFLEITLILFFETPTFLLESKQKLMLNLGSFMTLTNDQHSSYKMMNIS